MLQTENQMNHAVKITLRHFACQPGKRLLDRKNTAWFAEPFDLKAQTLREVAQKMHGRHRAALEWREVEPA
jgi:hypothetical protein